MTFDDVWAEFQRRFADLARDVDAKTIGVASTAGRTTANAFPFGAYLSFGRQGDAGREDVVVSIDGKNTRDGVIMLTCDIARGDGYVLKDGPVLTVALSELECSPDVPRWVASVSAFLRAHTSLIVEELLATS